MSDLFGIGSIVGGVSSLIGNLGAAGMHLTGTKLTNETNLQIANQNLQYQREQQEYARNLQQTMFAREDSAVQRRRADLEAAGMNPVLAAGQGAQAGPVIQMQAPQNNYRMENPYAGAAPHIGALGSIIPQMLNLEAQRASIDRTRAEEKRINAEADALLQQTPIKTEGMRIANLVSGNTLTIQEQEIQAKSIENQFNLSTLNNRIDNIALLNKKYSSELVSMALDQAYKSAMTTLVKYQSDQTLAQTENTRAQLPNIRVENALIRQQTASSRANELATYTRREIDRTLGAYQVTAADKDNLIKAQTLELLKLDTDLQKMIVNGWKQTGLSPAMLAILNTVLGGIKAIK